MYAYYSFVDVFHLPKVILETRLINKRFEIVLIILKAILCVLCQLGYFGVNFHPLHKCKSRCLLRIWPSQKLWRRRQSSKAGLVWIHG